MPNPGTKYEFAPEAMINGFAKADEKGIYGDDLAGRAC